MKRLLLFSTVTMLFSCLYGQTIPLDSQTWNYTGKAVEFKTVNGNQKMLITPSSGKVIAKNIIFSDGIIEFDAKPKALSFFFRMNNDKELEYFYLRTARSGDSTAMDAIQYAPYIDGVLMWNSYPQFQSHANFLVDQENHFKFIIAGPQMQIFINSDTIPTLEVDHLEGNFREGTIGFEGNAEISNLMVDSSSVEGLLPKSGIDPTANDPRYIRKWAISDPIPVPEKVDFSYEFLPTPVTKWAVIDTERRGLVNIIRKFGNTEAKRLVWLKVNIESETDQRKRIDLGFLTEVWVFLNGQITYLDKNLEGRLMAKNPDGRISVENTSFELALKKGSNELLIGLANQYWGSGAIARVENMEGIKISPDPSFDSRMVELSAENLKAFSGTYSSAEGIGLTVSSDSYSLVFESRNFLNATAYPKSPTEFFVREFDVEFQFLRNDEQDVTGLDVILNGEKFTTLKKNRD